MRVERRSGGAAGLLTAQLPDPLPEAVAVRYDVRRPTLVLGSGQPDAVVDRAAAAASGTDVARRRSGGGAVLITPGRSIWIDLLLPRNDLRWSDDIVRATDWLGAAWATALLELGVTCSVHSTGLERTAWGRLVCFAALGPGEVVVDGRKVVGISQRRTRGGARFQCLVHAGWDPRRLLDLLVLDDAERERAAGELEHCAAGPGVPLADLEDAFLRQLV
jgi:lipoate---protein ligase